MTRALVHEQREPDFISSTPLGSPRRQEFQLKPAWHFDETCPDASARQPSALAASSLLQLMAISRAGLHGPQFQREQMLSVDFEKRKHVHAQGRESFVSSMPHYPAATSALPHADCRRSCHLAPEPSPVARRRGPSRGRGGGWWRRAVRRRQRSPRHRRPGTGAQRLSKERRLGSWTAYRTLAE